MKYYRELNERQKEQALNLACNNMLGLPLFDRTIAIDGVEKLITGSNAYVFELNKLGNVSAMYIRAEHR